MIKFTCAQRVHNFSVLLYQFLVHQLTLDDIEFLKFRMCPPLNLPNSQKDGSLNGKATEYFLLFLSLPPSVIGTEPILMIYTKGNKTVSPIQVSFAYVITDYRYQGQVFNYLIVDPKGRDWSLIILISIRSVFSGRETR